MNTFECATEFSWSRWGRQSLISILLIALLCAIGAQKLAGMQDGPATALAAQAPPYAQQTPEQLQRLVAPIALYPDSLVAQILAASTFPEQVVEADRWVQANPDLKGDALGQGRGSAALGPERQSARCISIRPWKYGQEPLLGVFARRRLLQSATRMSWMPCR